MPVKRYDDAMVHFLRDILSTRSTSRQRTPSTFKLLKLLIVSKAKVLMA
jgi:DNA-binding transcriptional MocR family regulator